MEECDMCFRNSGENCQNYAPLSKKNDDIFYLIAQIKRQESRFESGMSLAL